MSRHHSFSGTPKLESVAYYTTDAHARNLCFIQTNGMKLFLSYASLVAGLFMPEDKSIMLTFRTHTIVLKGHRLSDLLDSLAIHAVRHIIAVDERYTATEDETDSIVTHIIVKLA